MNNQTEAKTGKGTKARNSQSSSAQTHSPKSHSAKQALTILLAALMALTVIVPSTVLAESSTGGGLKI
jgi:hypothetical protein